jgi:hypothetical protein
MPSHRILLAVATAALALSASSLPAAAQAPDGPVVSDVVVRKRDNALRFALSEAATLRITFAKRTKTGGYKSISDVEGIPGDAGANTITHRLELSRGQYRVTITPIAPAGSAVSKAFTVKRKV